MDMSTTGWIHNLKNIDSQLERHCHRSSLFSLIHSTFFFTLDPFFFFYFFGCNMQKFLGQGSNLCHSSNQSHQQWQCQALNLISHQGTPGHFIITQLAQVCLDFLMDPPSPSLCSHIPEGVVHFALSPLCLPNPDCLSAWALHWNSPCSGHKWLSGH